MFSQKPVLSALLLGASLVMGSGALADVPRLLVVSGGTNPDLETLKLTRQALSGASSHVVVSDAESGEVLESVRALGVTCDAGEVQCAARVGALGGVDLVVVVVSRNDQLTLKMVDVVTSTERSSVTRPVAGADRRGAIASAVVELVTPELYVGTLTFNGGPAGASILVDGAPSGSLPKTDGLSLKPGLHDIVVEHEGKRLVEQRVEIVYQATASLEVPSSSLAEPSAPDDAGNLSQTLMWAGGISTAVFAVSTVALALLATTTFYVACNSLGPKLANPDNAALCLAALPIYTPDDDFSDDDEALYASMSVLSVVSTAMAVVAGLAGVGGAAVLGASFFVE